MLPNKVLALVKSLHQRPRSRLVPLPDCAAEFCELTPFAQGPLMDALLKAVRDRTQLAVQRNDFKLDQLQPHLFLLIRREHRDHAVDRLRRVERVQRAHHQVARLGR